MKISSRIDGTIINLDVNSSNHYGIMLSGGLDSAVLLGLLALGKINVRPFSIAKTDGSIYRVSDIIECINQKFKVKIPNTTIVGNPLVHHSKQNESGVAEVLSKYKLDGIFMAINQNPPDNVKLLGLYPNRILTSPHPKVFLPFIHLYKTHIVDLIYQFDLEELLNITHSCTEQQIGRCGVCFQCSERKWAFDWLGKEDTGLM